MAKSRASANSTQAPAASASGGEGSHLRDLQIELLLPLELSFLLASEELGSAESLLDLGTGADRYTGEVKRFFPNLTCMSLAVPGLAVQGPGGAVLARNDLREHPFDVVVMRFAAKHFAGLADMLAYADGFLRPGGMLCMVELDQSAHQNFPRTPVFNALIADHERHMAGAARERSFLLEMCLAIADSPDWDLARTESRSVCRLGPFAGTPVLEMYQLWASVAHRSLGARSLDDALAELERWSSAAHALTRLGIEIVQLEKRQAVAAQSV